MSFNFDLTPILNLTSASNIIPHSPLYSISLSTVHYNRTEKSSLVTVHRRYEFLGIRIIDLTMEIAYVVFICATSKNFTMIFNQL